jgi:hypothetical protein
LGGSFLDVNICESPALVRRIPKENGILHISRPKFNTSIFFMPVLAETDPPFSRRAKKIGCELRTIKILAFVSGLTIYCHLKAGIGSEEISTFGRNL